MAINKINWFESFFLFKFIFDYLKYVKSLQENLSSGIRNVVIWESPSKNIHINAFLVEERHTLRNYAHTNNFAVVTPVKTNSSVLRCLSDEKGWFYPNLEKFILMCFHYLKLSCVYKLIIKQRHYCENVLII